MDVSRLGPNQDFPRTYIINHSHVNKPPRLALASIMGFAGRNYPGISRSRPLSRHGVIEVDVDFMEASLRVLSEVT